MRVLVVHPGPHFSVADVHRGWCAGLEANGCQVSEFNLGDRITFYASVSIEWNGETRRALDNDAAVRAGVAGVEAACYRCAPDVVLIVSGFFIPHDTIELMRARGSKVVMLHTESPYEDDKQLERAAWNDLNLLNDPTNLDRFKAVAPTSYAPHAYDPAVHYLRRPDRGKESDFFFCGTGYESRIEFLEACDLPAKSKLAGNWQALSYESPLLPMVVHNLRDCMDNDVAHEWYSATKASVNLYRREADRPELSEGWSMGPREVELAASGTFFLREPRGEGDEVFPMLPTFTGPEDFSEQLRWWLEHDHERWNAAREARDAVKDRTFQANAAEMLRLLD